MSLEVHFYPGTQGCGSVFIFSGSGYRVWGWIPIRIRIQSGSRALMSKNWKKNTAEEFFLLFFFWSKTAIYLSLGLHKVCPSYRRSLQLSKEAIQHFKTWTLTNFFLLLWVIFALLDPDPDPQSRLNPDPIRIRIRNPGYSTSFSQDWICCFEQVCWIGTSFVRLLYWTYVVHTIYNMHNAHEHEYSNYRIFCRCISG